MYGLGVRLGFYLQSASNILATVFLVDGDENGRANSAILCFALLIAFGFSIPNDPMALEVPIFIALITLISLPPLSLPIFRRHQYEGNFKSYGSLLALALVYVTACGSCIWGDQHEWFDQASPCPVYSGLGGSSAISPNGWTAWTVLLSLETGVAVVLLCVTTFKASRGRPRPSSQEHWAETMLWTAFSVGLLAVCVASVELTIFRHKISTPVLSNSELGQWMSLCAGIGAILSFIWSLLPSGGSYLDAV